jgi:hypothetical protein
MEEYPNNLKDAKQLNSIYYFTGKSCPHGHVSKRYTKSSRCVECVLSKQKKLGNKYTKKSREKNKEKILKKSIEDYRKIGKKYIYLMWSRAKKRSREKNVPFDIELSDINIPTYCPVLGNILEISNCGRGPGDNSPSLDRKDPKLGYVKGNIEVISFKANRIKSDAEILDLQKVLIYMEKMKTK